MAVQRRSRENKWYGQKDTVECITRIERERWKKRKKKELKVIRRKEDYDEKNSSRY